MTSISLDVFNISSVLLVFNPEVTSTILGTSEMSEFDNGITSSSDGTLGPCINIQGRHTILANPSASKVVTRY